MTEADIKRLSKAFKALSNPNRLQIFINLLEESQDAGSLQVHNCFLAKLIRNLNVGAPTVSHHIKELVNAELIRTTKDGKQLICSINPDMVSELKRVFEEGLLAPALPLENERERGKPAAKAKAKVATT